MDSRVNLLVYNRYDSAGVTDGQPSTGAGTARALAHAAAARQGHGRTRECGVPVSKVDTVELPMLAHMHMQRQDRAGPVAAPFLITVPCEVTARPC